MNTAARRLIKYKLLKYNDISSKEVDKLNCSEFKHFKQEVEKKRFYRKGQRGDMEA